MGIKLGKGKEDSAEGEKYTTYISHLERRVQNLEKEKQLLDRERLRLEQELYSLRAYTKDLEKKLRVLHGEEAKQKK